MTTEQQKAADEYLEAVESLVICREREMDARRTQTKFMNDVVDAERKVKVTQEAFTKAFGITKL